MSMDIERICRICLESNKQTFNIFTSFYWKRNVLYHEMIENCTKLKPSIDDGLPKLICKECTKQLKKSYTFSLLCEDSDKKLKIYLETYSKLHADSNSISGEDLDVKDEKLEYEITEFHETDHKILELLNQNVNTIKEEIKTEPNLNDDGSDNCWDADDNMLLDQIKSSKEYEDTSYTLRDVNSAIDNEKPKKKRGRKKKVFLEGEAPRVPISKSPHQCDICGKVLSTKSNLKAHKVCHTEVRPFKCPVCPASFRGHSALFQHKKVHSGETPYHCEYCPKQFGRRSGLVNHIRMHTGEKQYSCHICYKTFVQSAQLSTHMKRHKGDKSYLCQDCGKGFAIKADLKVHERVHSGEKPYSCHLCTKTFATSGNLSIHVRIHKKEVRYNCKECHRGFVTRSSYNVHLKRHKGQRDYSCECGKTFYTLSCLKQHKVTHTGEKKYQCKLCERKFTQSSHLGRHFRRDHSKPNMPMPSSDHYKIILRSSQESVTTLSCELRFIDNPVQKLDEEPAVKCEG